MCTEPTYLQQTQKSSNDGDRESANWVSSRNLPVWVSRLPYFEREIRTPPGMYGLRLGVPEPPPTTGKVLTTPPTAGPTTGTLPAAPAPVPTMPDAALVRPPTGEEPDVSPPTVLSTGAAAPPTTGTERYAISRFSSEGEGRLTASHRISYRTSNTRDWARSTGETGYSAGNGVERRTTTSQAASNAADHWQISSKASNGEVIRKSTDSISDTRNGIRPTADTRQVRRHTPDDGQDGRGTGDGTERRASTSQAARQARDSVQGRASTSQSASEPSNSIQRGASASHTSKKSAGSSRRGASSRRDAGDLPLVKRERSIGKSGNSRHARNRQAARQGQEGSTFG